LSIHCNRVDSRQVAKIIMFHVGQTSPAATVFCISVYINNYEWLVADHVASTIQSQVGRRSGLRWARNDGQGFVFTELGFETSELCINNTQ